MEYRPRPQNYANLFLDMNAFFASCEQQVQPTLRGRPIAVTPYTGPTGCVIAKSYQAKDFGIQTGDLIKDARTLCPELEVIESRPALYTFYHKEIIKMLERHSPFVTPLSIDEFVIKLKSHLRARLPAIRIAQNIKQDIRQNVGDYLKCSIGIGANKFLAKVAAESKKPDGLTVVALSELEPFYRRLDLLDIPGINWRLQRQLNARGIYTALDLYQRSMTQLRRAFGHPGKVWWLRLRGYEVDDLKIPVKTIGHSHVLAPKFRSREAARKILVKLVKKAGTRLRRAKLSARGVAVGIGFWQTGWFHQLRRCDQFNDNQSFIKNALAIFNQCRFPGRPMMVAVSAVNLVRPRGAQINIFPEIEKSRRASRAADKICDKFGPEAIYPASMLGIDTAAPDRIPFGQPRYEIDN